MSRSPATAVRLLLGCAVVGLALLGAACDRPPRLEPARATALRQALELPGLDLAAPLRPHESTPIAGQGFTVSPLAFDLGVGTTPPWRVAGALFRPDQPTGAGLLVAHGHFEGGKSTPEAQLIAARAASRGALVLAVDTPGVEEWDRPDRAIHFEAGAHGRAFLAAGGTSAMALQLAGLRRGLALLRQEGADEIAVAGASGGAVQAFYLGLLEPDLAAIVLASVPPMPRELRASGCACDQLPGWPGPDPRVLAEASTPTLWMTETPSPRPEGLPRGVRFEVVEGDHSFTEAMQRQALAFLGQYLELREQPMVEHDMHDLRGPGPDEEIDPPGIFDLPLEPTARWQPHPEPLAPYELNCSGTGPVVLVAGGGAAELSAARDLGLQPCSIRVPLAPADLSEALGSGGTVVDRLAGAILRAGQLRSAIGVLGVRAWALPAAASGLPAAVQDWPETPEQVDPARDPAWIHVPGGWWGVNQALLSGAVATGGDPSTLLAALAAAAGVAPPSPPADDP